MKRILSLLLILTVLMSGVAYGATSQSVGKITVNNVDSNITKAGMEKIKEKAQKAEINIMNYFNIKNMGDVAIHIQTQGVGSFNYADVFLSKWHIDRNMSGIAGRMACAIIQYDARINSNDVFFASGVFTLMEQLYGDKNSFDQLTNKNVLKKTSIHDVLELYKKYSHHLSFLMNDYYKLKDRNERKMGQYEVGSFFIFLNNKYGKDKINKLYYSKNPLDFEGVYGKDINTLEKEWKAYYNIKFSLK